jgi:hypothetical protein
MSNSVTKAVGDRGVVRRILARVDLDDLARRIDLNLREVRYYEPCQRSTLLDHGGPVLRANLELFMRWLRDGVAPGSDDLAELRAMFRIGAARGKKAHEQIVVYNQGIRFMWSALLETATDEERAELTAHSEIVLDYQSIISQAVSDVYQAEAGAAFSCAERRTGIILDWLVGPDPVSSEITATAQAVGFSIADRYRPFVAVMHGSSITAHAGLAQRLREAGALAATKLDHVEGLVSDTFTWSRYAEDPKLLVVADRSLARADLPAGFEDVRAVAAMARQAALSGSLLVEDYLPQLLLARSPRIAERLEQRVYAPLAGHNADELTATLKTLAATNFDRAATAAALPVHRNTVLYRVNRIQKITGLDFGDHRDLTMIWLATMWRDMAD